MAAPAFGLGDVLFVAEDRFSNPLDPVGYIARFPGMTPDAVFFTGDAECLDPGMAGAARFGFFHIGHGEVATFPDIENGIMTNLAIIVIFSQVECVAEYYRIRVPEFELDILGLGGG
jgi:hypothetical protein